MFLTPMELINEILFWICWYVLMWNGYFLLFNKGIPNIRTAPPIRKKVIELLKDRMANDLRRPFIIMDPGAGNGDFSRQIAKALPDAKVIGVEISWLAYLRCVLMQKLMNVKNLSYVRSDFLKHDFSSANAVVMFILGSLMGPLRGKLETDLKPGAYVLANRFPVAGEWVPSEVIDVPTLAPNQKTLYVYDR